MLEEIKASKFQLGTANYQSTNYQLIIRGRDGCCMSYNLLMNLDETCAEWASGCNVYVYKGLVKTQFSLKSYTINIPWHIDGSVEHYSISIAKAMEILQSCTKPLTWWKWEMGVLSPKCDLFLRCHCHAVWIFQYKDDILPVEEYL